MNIVSDLQTWRDIRKSLSHKTIGFVPTMGNLHAGHISLVQRASQENDIAVVSIFINPTQFNQTNDFEHYPRTLQADLHLLEQFDGYVFVPDVRTIYSDDYQFKIIETEIAKELEGECRPGHFDGMLTVVMKLLNIIQATRAYFGEKDYQQLLLVKKMVSAFFLPVEIIAGETVRSEDGLALSSRNSRLTPQQREHAAHFPRLLSAELSLEQIHHELTQLDFKVDYIVEKWQRRLGAVCLGEVRLIDNKVLSC